MAVGATVIPTKASRARRVQLRELRGQSLHHDELQADRAQRFVHVDTRSRTLDAQSLFSQNSAVPVLQLHHLRAEVASTFNEQLLTHYLLKNTSDLRLKAYLLNHEIDSIRATIVRQTMFAEFEKQTHEMAQRGDGLTVQSFRDCYAELLKAYFGPNFVIDEQLSLECFRIPHFYRAFYVYKYATGLAAAIALSRRVLEGGESERADYLRFLSSGCSKDPLDLLKDAGVDMTSPEPIEIALRHFDNLVGQLDELV